jgi:hypothetical protein
MITYFIKPYHTKFSWLVLNKGVSMDRINRQILLHHIVHFRQKAIHITLYNSIYDITTVFINFQCLHKATY